MPSLFDDLSGKLARDPRLIKRGGARFDLSLLLFNARDSLSDLWRTAERYAESREEGDLEALRAALERLRPIFGERPGISGDAIKD